MTSSETSDETRTRPDASVVDRRPAGGRVWGGLGRDGLEAFRSSAVVSESRGEPDPLSRRLLHESGLLKLAIPGTYGGPCLEPAEMNRALSEVAEANPSLAIVVYLHTAVVLRVATFGSPGQQAALFGGILASGDIWASAWSEPGVGADKRVVGTAVTRDAGLTFIDGRKHFCTGATLAHGALILAQEPETPSQSFWLLPASLHGLSFEPTPMDLLGMRGSGTGSLSLTSCSVTESHQFARERTVSEVMAHPQSVGLSLGAVALGIVRRVIDLAAHRAGDQLTSRSVAELTLLEGICHAQLGAVATAPPAHRETASLTAKVVNTRAAVQACARVRELLGSASFMRSHELNQLANDAQALIQMGPTNEQCLTRLASAGSRLETSRA